MCRISGTAFFRRPSWIIGLDGIATTVSVISSIYLFAIVMGLITALPVYADNTYVQTSSDEYEAPLIIT